MKNVYDEVQIFYDEEIDWDPLIERDWIEGFLRQKAWQGADDKELRGDWRNLKMFILYLAHSDHDDLDEISYREYSLAIEWFAGFIPGFKATLRTVRRFLAVLTDFYQFLQSKKIIDSATELERATHLIVGGKKLELIKVMPNAERELQLLEGDLNKVFSKSYADLPGEASKNIGAAIERLMVRLGSYFQQEDFSEDFQRALFLYTGPFETIPDEEHDEFWLGFWDYFLLDYHLLINDKTSLAHFNATYAGKITPDEQHILRELLAARFIVFYVNRILSQEWVECIDLFSGEKFQLPCPDFDYKKMKKLLFFGHVFFRDTMLINYVTSIEISINLRRRIKQEVLLQKAIFEIQQPGATWQQFFNRHALAVRHTVDMLVTLAKVNVTPFDQMGREFPTIVETRTADPHVQQAFSQLMPEYGFSRYDIRLAEKLWHDFYQLTGISIRKPGAWAATILYVYSQLNSPHGILAEDLAHDFSVSAASIYNNRAKFYKALQLRQYDPRYLNEEGFIFSLFMS